MKRNDGRNALLLLTAKKSRNVMERLKSADPPFLLKEDVRNYDLLYTAVRYENIEITKDHLVSFIIKKKEAPLSTRHVVIMEFSRIESRKRYA